jgi:hypothetical protein
VSKALRGALGRLRRAALRPVLSDLAEIGVRLDHLSKRLDEIEAVLQTTQARASTVTEKAAEVSESQARMARRIEGIERILGGT